MPGYLLETMPSIHASIIGFIGAISCAFGVIVFTKIREFGDARDDIVNTVKMASNLNNANSIEITQNIIKGDRVDWSLALKMIGRIRHKMADEQKLEYTKDLVGVLARAFNAYPFSESGHYFSASIKRRDLQWWADFNYMVQSLANFKDKNGSAVFEVAKFADKEEWGNWSRQYAHLPPEYILGFKEDLGELYTLMVIEYFRKIDSYVRLLVEVEKTVEAEKRWLEDFNIIKIKNDLVWVFSLVFASGVIVPMILLQLRIDYNICMKYGVCWNPLYAYMLFMFSILPYLYLVFRGAKGFGKAPGNVERKDKALYRKFKAWFRTD